MLPSRALMASHQIDGFIPLLNSGLHDVPPVLGDAKTTRGTLPLPKSFAQLLGRRDDLGDAGSTQAKAGLLRLT